MRKHKRRLAKRLLIAARFNSVRVSMRAFGSDMSQVVAYMVGASHSFHVLSALPGYHIPISDYDLNGNPIYY